VAFLFIGQVVFGIYLKFHLERGINKYIRRAAVMCHGTIGKITPIVSWIQMGFGGITLLGFCRADHLGQVLWFLRSIDVVSRSWNYGEQFYCVWGCDVDYVVGGSGMADQTEQKPRILR
jgi:hypothetical protein